MSLRQTTVGDFISQLRPGWRRNFQPRWPPDVFAIAAGLLQKSGAYADIVMGQWPPTGTGRAWARTIKNIGLDWRGRCIRGDQPPARIREWWSTVARAHKRPVSQISAALSPKPPKPRSSLCEALVQLCAAADEASVNLGLPARKIDDFEYDALGLLEPDKPGGSTLCKRIDSSRCRVLPKMHTPQRGLTVRSLSHNLALCPSADIEARWEVLSKPRIGSQVNVLLVPWPFVVRPKQFRPAKPMRGPLRNMGKTFGFFDYMPSPAAELPETIAALVEESENRVGAVDVVVLPELALASDDYELVRDAALARSIYFVCGVQNRARPRGFGQNTVRFDTKLDSVISGIDPQPKHHRWLIDNSQVVQYGLGGNLAPSIKWWENIEVGARRLTFWALGDWLTVCVLICEDLARQDPVADVVRAVGPNLVIALLMDGPQLTSRWAARYATVLADDPGSSVLTLTSLGMAQLSRPPGKSPSRVIGLWKDTQKSDPVEIELPNDHGGVLLSLAVQYLEEFTADGRSDRSKTGCPILSGVHPIPIGARTVSSRR